MQDPECHSDLMPWLSVICRTYRLEGGVASRGRVATPARAPGVDRRQENQLDSLGIMVNVIVLWQTVCTQAALEHLAASGCPLDPADVARLTPARSPHDRLDGRYRTTSRPPTTGLRPLRTD